MQESVGMMYVVHGGVGGGTGERGECGSCGCGSVG